MSNIVFFKKKKILFQEHGHRTPPRLIVAETDYDSSSPVSALRPDDTMVTGSYDWRRDRTVVYETEDENVRKYLLK